MYNYAKDLFGRLIGSQWEEPQWPSADLEMEESRVVICIAESWRITVWSLVLISESGVLESESLP